MSSLQLRAHDASRSACVFASTLALRIFDAPGDGEIGDLVAQDSLAR
jgi:hypothetical protein